jgi:PPP family 3-phenylpropionic acid transporter
MAKLEAEPSNTKMSARAFSLSPLGRFVILYAALYSGFGAASPFLPALVQGRGISPEQIGLLFGAGTAVRLLSAPIAGRVADRTHALRMTLAICAAASALAALGYLAAWGFWAILAVTIAYAFALAPTTNLADALALVASRSSTNGFEYGWVRGAGSAAFIAGSVVAGAAIWSYGLSVVAWMQALLMLAVPIASRLVPAVEVPHRVEGDGYSPAQVSTLIRSPVFSRVVLVAALILGSHSMHDTFAVIRWTAAGIPPRTAGILWSLSIVAEVAVFLVIGPRLVGLLTPAGAIRLAALAGACRWLVAALTADVTAIVLIQPLHGITFALLHLACMRLLSENIHTHIAATAQAIYGTVGVGAATALMTFVSGLLYGKLGPSAFACMSVLCLAALPIAAGLRPKRQG